MHILVTGGAGFIGSTYVRALLSGDYPAFAGADVTVLDKLTYAGNPANLAAVAGRPGFRLVSGDIADAPLVRELLVPGSVVVNFAAETHVDRSIDDAGSFVHTNVTGTHVLLETALRQRADRFLQVSTDEVYGSIPTGSWTESSPCCPTPRTRPRRRRRTCWPSPTSAPTASTYGSPGAATTTAPTSTRRS